VVPDDRFFTLGGKFDQAFADLVWDLNGTYVETIAHVLLEVVHEARVAAGRVAFWSSHLLGPFVEVVTEHVNAGQMFGRANLKYGLYCLVHLQGFIAGLGNKGTRLVQ
jgi:hypothetical protein